MLFSALPSVVSAILAGVLVLVPTAVTPAGSPPAAASVIRSSDVDEPLVFEGSAPVIGGAPAVGITLAIGAISWSLEPDLVEYSWLREGEAIPLAVGATYTLTADDEGKSIAVEVAATREGFDPVLLRSDPVGPVALGTLTASTPSLGGSALVGQTLTATPNAWSPDPGFGYQWYRDSTLVAGADQSQYQLGNDDVGHAITVVVTGSLAGYAPASRTSVATPVVTGGIFDAPAPQIAGIAGVGLSLTASAPGWVPGPTTLTYQWKRNGVAIAAATKATYVLTAADAGRAITVTVTGVRDRFITATRTSAATPAVTLAFSALPVPTVAGVLRAGSVLTATSAAWGPAATLSYQWNRDGVAILGATARTYLLTTDDAGARITVTVSGTRAGYTTSSRTSVAKVIELPLTQTPAPSIDGSPDVGRTITAVSGDWEPTPVTLTYQWKRNGVAIAGATKAAYKVTTLDQAKTLTVTVTGKRTGYTAVATTSAGVAVPRLLALAPVPTITGVPAIGSTLAAKSATWTPDPVTLTYQWRSNGADIPDATSATYVIQPADAGNTLTVVVTGAKAGYTSVARTSLGTVVQRPLTATPTPTISGTNEVGFVLTATTDPWGPAPVTLAYQWLRDGVAIKGATLYRYPLVAADANRSITVRVTGSKTGYTAVQSVSDPLAILGVFTFPTPTIAGSLAIGSTISVRTTGLSPQPDLITYQWKRNGIVLDGAWDTSYVLREDDGGARMTVTVSVERSGYSSSTKTSAASAAVALPRPPSSDRTYRVGIDVGVGTFVTTGSTSLCYWERVSDFSGSFASIISNDIGSGQRIVTIEAGDAGFRSSRCGTWTNIQKVKKLTSIPDSGVFAVNQQLTPGLWRSATGKTTCYWATLSGFSGSLDDIIDNDFGAGPAYVQITSDMVGFESSRCGGWTRVSD